MFGNMTPEERAKVDRWARRSQWLSGLGLAILIAPFALVLLAGLIILLIILL